jgi:hypothetical protein
MRFLATGLRTLNLIVFPLETPAVLLDRHGLFDKVLCPVLLIDPGAIPFCRPLDHRPDLGECRDFALATVLLIVPATIRQLRDSEMRGPEVLYLCGSKTERSSSIWKSRFNCGVTTVFGRLNQSDPADSSSSCTQVSKRPLRSDF